MLINQNVQSKRVNRNVKRGERVNMNITSVGDTFHYQYNFKTNKLVNCNDEEDMVVQYVNNETFQDTDQSGMNQYDKELVIDLIDLLNMFHESTSGLNKINKENSSEDTIDIEAIIDSSSKTIFKVNGEETFISECALDMIIDDIEKNDNNNSSMIQSDHISYRSDRNELGIATGESFVLGNGRKITFHDSYIELIGNDRKNQSLYDYYKKMKDGLEKLLYVTKSDWIHGNISSLNMNEAFDFLQSLGLDTSKTFRLNGSVYEVSDDNIDEKQYVNKQISRKSYYASLYALDLWNQQKVSSKLYYDHLFTYKHGK